MLFEIRTSVPPVSPEWEAVRDAFLGGQVRKAWSLAVAQRGVVPLTTPNDYLLCIEVARGCSAAKLYMALVRQGVHRFPDDPILQLYHARVLLTRNRHLEAIDFLLQREGTLGQSHRAWWGTELGNVYGSAGFARSSEEWLDKVSHEPDIDSPLALYTRSSAHEGLQRWDQAIELAYACVNAAPRWSRARAYLAYCLLARGRIEEAREQLRMVRDQGIEESMVDVTSAMLSLSLGQFPAARMKMEQILEHWPQSDSAHWIRRTLCVLLVELGEGAAARQLVEGFEERYALPKIPEPLTGRHKYLPMPVISQNRNQCVPTTVAMAAYPQGREFDPDELFREMHGREGTQLWRMREWCDHNGFEVIPIRLEVEAIRAMIDADVPLIGVLEGAFSSHVDVICGYNDDLEGLYVRDPGHWALIAYPVELALARYKMHNGVMAVLSRDRSDFGMARQTALSYLSDEFQALLDLAKATSTGDRVQAERAYAAIDDASPAAFMREHYAVQVAISPVRFYERMKEICLDAEAPQVARFRSAMALRPEDGHSALESLIEDQKGSLGVHGLAYLDLVAAMQQGRWQDALTLIDRLLKRGANIAYFWELKSDILAELGDHEGSREALDKAIELEPLRSSVREKALTRDVNHINQEAFLEEFHSIMALDPDDKRLLISRVRVLEDGPDGREYEAAAYEALKWFPRSPVVYQSLLAWYQFQGREDLHDRLMQQAREMLPDVFDDESAESDQDDSQQQSDDDSELPDEPQQLMSLAWSDADERGQRALKKLRDMQQHGSLHWYEAARLVALQLLKVSDGSLPESELPDLLPEKPPGAAHWFADLCLDVLTDGNMSRMVADHVERWLMTTVPNFTSYPDLWFKRVLVLEQAGRIEEALLELQELVSRFPAFASGLYRMGAVKLQQRDYSSARRYFEQALEVNPGLLGALHLLRQVCETTFDRAGTLECIRKMRRRFPYSFDYLRDEARAAVELVGSVDEGIKTLRNSAGDFPESRLRLLEADLLVDADRIEDAAKIANSFELDESLDETLFEDVLRSKLRIALVKEDREQVLKVCDVGLKRWPDANLLMEIKADTLKDTDPQAAADLLKQILYRGEPGDKTVGALLSLQSSDVDEFARQTVMDAPEDRRQWLAEQVADTMLDPAFLNWATPFLEWASQQFPGSKKLHLALAEHWNMSGRLEDAVDVAQRLYDRDPDDVAATRCLGRVLMDVDAERAIPLLERVAAQDRNVDVLFDLARANQLIRRPEQARTLHEEVLTLNPYVAASWTNLFFLKADPESLWEKLDPILERGAGVQDQYFLVAAVELAVRLRRALHPNWLHLAVERRLILETYPPFRDEKDRLDAALAAWAWVRPLDLAPYPHVRFSWFKKLKSRLSWPGARWIPTSSV